MKPRPRAGVVPFAALCCAAALCAGVAPAAVAPPPQRFAPPLRGRGPALPPARQFVVVALGDSITYGLGDDGVGDCAAPAGAGGFCALLNRRGALRVVNEGLCGERSAGARDRVEGVLERWRPDALLVLVGVNDREVAVGDVVGNLRSIVAAAKRRGVLPLLGTLTPVAGPHADWEPFVLSLNEAIRRLAREERVPLADHHDLFGRVQSSKRETRPLLAPDGLHPVAAGYRIMAAAWDRALHEALRQRAPGGPAPAVLAHPPARPPGTP